MAEAIYRHGELTPLAVGDTFAGFEVVEIRRYAPRLRGLRSGHTSPFWVCQSCGAKTNGRRLAWWMLSHESRGHAPCEFCGKVLANRADGTPRQHRYNACPGKDDSHRMVLAMAKDVAR